MAFIAIGGALVAGTAAAVSVIRRRNRARYESGVVNDGPRTVMPGAEPIAYDRDGRGVLILHGFGDTTQSVQELAAFLHGRSWNVRAPLLPGHGTSLKAFTAARADDWLAAARSALREMHARCSSVVIVGQSMGGTLATILAAESQVSALVLLVPYMRMSPRALWSGRFHHLVSLVLPYLRSRSESSILDPEARGRALGKGVTTPRLLHELDRIVCLARAAAPSVRVPTLVIHSAQDPRIRATDAEAAFAALGCETKSLKWVRRSGHVLSVDYDREWVFREVAEWLDGHGSPA